MRKNWEVEDGMGFAGLVPTAAEKRQEAAEQRERERIAQLQAERDALAEALKLTLFGMQDALARKPIRDADEIIEYARAVLAKVSK
jgi:hypothetical protein